MSEGQEQIKEPQEGDQGPEGWLRGLKHSGVISTPSALHGLGLLRYGPKTKKQTGPEATQPHCSQGLALRLFLPLPQAQPHLLQQRLNLPFLALLLATVGVTLQAIKVGLSSP